MSSRAEHAALLAKVDAFSAAVVAGQGPWLACRRGCDGCCRLRRTAWAVEVDALRAHVQTLSPDVQAALSARRSDPAVVAGERCVFLDPDGACAVYDARPVICRTHGPAVSSADGGVQWCDLGFGGLDVAGVVERVPPGSILDLDRLNTLLAVVNARFLAARPGPARLPLDAALEDHP
ncbi:MAG: YkgJ family cysteine cluster protein [bacterium]